MAQNTSQKGKSKVPPTKEEQSMRAWLRLIPQNGTGAPLGHTKRSDLFKMALSFVAKEEASMLHQVIKNLASEGGLLRISEVLDYNLLDLGSEDRCRFFERNHLPLLQNITQGKVVSSLILQKSVGDIFVFLYGVRGQRAVKCFTTIASILQAKIENTAAPETSETIYIWVTAVLAALSKLLDSNQSASINDDLHLVVDTIQAFLDITSTAFSNTLREQETQQYMVKVRRHLNYGANLKPAMAQKSLGKKSNATFDLQFNGPGQLSELGPRHDNDSENIADIKILPTYEEIMSQRAEYLPTIDPQSWHEHSIRGLLDQQFRLLREDTVGQLRDCVRSIVEKLTNNSADTGVRRRLNFYEYANVTFSNVIWRRRNRLQVMVQFDQPKSLIGKSEPQRRKWWEETRQLQVDALVCVANSKGHTLWLSVAERHGVLGSVEDERSDSEASHHVGQQGTRLDLWNDPLRASITLKLIDKGNQDFTLALGGDTDFSDFHQVLVEFPGVLLPSFRPTLAALQRMSVSGDVAFAEKLVPSFAERLEDKEAHWPRYAQQPRFEFDLQDVLHDESPLSLKRTETVNLEVLRQRSTLDNAQCKAFVGALSRDFALIQGPPGTGKSYVAVQIVKILLKHRIEADMHPIIIVCYTNHALDQFLEHLVNDGVKQIMRIGGRSKLAVLEPLNLRNKAGEMELTKAEKHLNWELRSSLESHGREVEDLFKKLRNAGFLSAVLEYLGESHPDHYKQLKTLEDEEGFKVVGNRRGDNLQQWLNSGISMVRGDTTERPLQVLQHTPLSLMTQGERRVLYDEWVSVIRGEIAKEIPAAIRQYATIEEDLTTCNHERDLRCLQQAHVIGLTTSGLAQNTELLMRLHPKVLLCEEAAEILEAHTLTAFMPSIEHAILIGDHEQLRPQVANYELSSQKRGGERFSLDLSLFERLITMPESDLRHDTLQTQRRMDPSISNLIRQTIYPNLLDHESVLGYPAVVGIRKRLFWLDHAELERSYDSAMHQTSHSNDYEVRVVASLVLHLLRQGIYDNEDIVVLTPYVRQLQEIRHLFSATTEIVTSISERDVAELDKEGIVDAVTAQQSTQRATLNRSVRVATIDNFQGEEAKIVIVSLVRSNKENNCGFLKTSNRINVLLSRAMHGLYIIGNSKTSRHVQMWDQVLSMLETSSNRGPSLPLCCPQHPNTTIEVATPEDFHLYAPEGGCSRQCNFRRDCGHPCTYKCHSENRCAASPCQATCPRRHKECDHACEKSCGEPCGRCTKPVRRITLNCGHVKEELPCYQISELDKVHCSVKVEVKGPCGHTSLVLCGTDPSSPSYKCKETCNWTLECGHQCRARCCKCRVLKDDGNIAVSHAKCTTVCGRDYQNCQHSCPQLCHEGKPCPLCTVHCSIACSHSACAKKCSEPCSPCCADCSHGCEHQGYCQMPCAVPCDIIPCPRRCEALLPCGHQCPTLCGEKCPDPRYCQTCAVPTVKDQVVDLLQGRTYAEMDLQLQEDLCIFPQCGHISSVESMDGWLEMNRYYDIASDGGFQNLCLPGPEPLRAIAKGCPHCRSSLRSINRYNRIEKRVLLDEATKKFIVWSNAAFVPLTSELRGEEQALEVAEEIAMSPNQDHFRPKLNVTLSGGRGRQIEEIRGLSGLEHRLGNLLGLRSTIAKLAYRCRVDEQPFARVKAMAEESARKLGKTESFTFDTSVLQTRAGLLTSALLLQCDYDILSDVLNIYRNHKPREEKRHTWLKAPIKLDLSINGRECLELTNQAHGKDQPSVVVQAQILYAKYAAIERMAPADPSSSKELTAKARDQLDLARNNIKEFPSTSYLLDQIEQVSTMLREETFYTIVTSKEQQEVYNAMAQEFSGTGHWYYCVNGHPFTVGECGMPMQSAQCPQCGAAVGGTHHNPAEGVTRATDLEQEFGRMRM